MKKILAVLLAGVMLCGFAACSSSGETSSTGSASSGNTAAGSTAPSNEALSGIVKTGGSTSVEKVMNALIYQFQDENRDVTVNYEMNGSGDGIQGVIDGKYEIGHSSRDLKDEEKEAGLEGTAYAIDGIAVVVNAQNGVTNLTKDQLLKIYSGEITNWSEVGGSDAPITVVT
ncbi:MAG: substrate-binding domain-containing protein, partial [Clostridiales bacterium]|nr:substrate-binding domain-containing protein [Clostridiales bacterium]